MPRLRKLVGADDQTRYHCGADLGMRGRLLAGAANGDEKRARRGVVASLASPCLCRFGRDPAQRGGRVGRGALGLLSPSNWSACSWACRFRLWFLPVSGGA